MMDEILPVFWPYYLIALSLAACLGAIAQRSRFCLQGGLRDWYYLGDNSRLITYLSAMAFAILAASTLEVLNLTNLDATKPAYRSVEFAWGRYLVGGFIFGFGMVLAAGCGFRQLIKSSEGSVKALWLITLMALAIYLLTRTNGFGDYVLPLFSPLSLSLTSQQDIGSLLSENASSSARLMLGISLSALASWYFARTKCQVSAWLPALGVAVVVALGYVLTGGDYATFLAEEASFMSNPPYGLGSQSFTVSAPLGDVVYFLNQRELPQVTFGVLAIAGVWLGSTLSAVSSKKFKLTGFTSWRDFGISSLGSLLAAFGAVLAMGCSIGHGITGIATLSLGSIIATIAIAAGGIAAIKVIGQPNSHC